MGRVVMDEAAEQRQGGHSESRAVCYSGTEGRLLMCLWIDEFSEVIRASTPRARKEHKCGECGRTIEPGERYHRWDCKEDWATGLVTYKMCAHCRGVVAVGATLADCPEQWYWDMVLDWRDEGGGFVADIIRHDDLPPGSVIRMLRLVVLSKRGWRDRRGELVPIPAP